MTEAAIEERTIKKERRSRKGVSLFLADCASIFRETMDRCVARGQTLT